MGRIARSGVWDIEITRLMREERISGIPLLAWQAFLSAFRERSTLEDAMRSIRAIAAKYGENAEAETARAMKIIADELARLGEHINLK